MVHAAPLGSVPQFDATGTAYLSSHCSGTVAIAPAHSRHFSRTIVTRGAAKSFTLALSGAGQGLAAWIAGACSYDETTPPQNGAVLIRLLRDGAFTETRTLTSNATDAIRSSAVAVSEGGIVSWDVTAANGVEEPFSAKIGADGVPGATQQGADAVIPITADAGGDAVLEGGRAANSYGPGAPVATPPFVRPAGGGPDQPAPSPSFSSLTSAPAGRVFALAWPSSPTTLEYSVWRP